MTEDEFYNLEVGQYIVYTGINNYGKVLEIYPNKEIRIFWEKYPDDRESPYTGSILDIEKFGNIGLNMYEIIKTDKERLIRDLKDMRNYPDYG